MEVEKLRGHWVTRKKTKPTVNKCNDERIPHVKARHWDPAPDTARRLLSGRGGAGEGRTGANQHSMLVCLPGGGTRGLRVLPVAAPALPASEARRQKPCMPASRSEENHQARWGRGREAAGEGGEGRWATRGRVRWTEEKMDRQRDGRKGKEADDERKQKKRHS